MKWNPGWRIFFKTIPEYASLLPGYVLNNHPEKKDSNG